jgi:hypothetical protein
LRYLILSTALLAGSASQLASQPFCSAVAGTATIQLTSAPYAQFPAVIELSEFYGSAATLGTPSVIVTGNQIVIDQANTVAWALPTTTCRVRAVNLGTLSPGRYDVTWTTTETQSPLLNPPTLTRTRTFTFVILPAEAIPSTDRYLLFVLFVVLLGIGLAHTGSMGLS